MTRYTSDVIIHWEVSMQKNLIVAVLLLACATGSIAAKPGLEKKAEFRVGDGDVVPKPRCDGADTPIIQLSSPDPRKPMRGFVYAVPDVTGPAWTVFVKTSSEGRPLPGKLILAGTYCYTQ